VERELGTGISNFVVTFRYSFTYNAIWISRQTCLLYYNTVDMNNFPSLIQYKVRLLVSVTIWGTSHCSS
jgi:hypothetical protein